MNTSIAKDPMAFVMLASVSEAGIIDRRAVDHSRNEPPHQGLLERLMAAAKWLAELPRRHAVIAELSSLSDHELSDIGLNRAELGRVFQPDPVADRSRMATQRG